jgi:hypothetical protein
MSDAFLMRRIQSGQNLACILDSLFDRQWPFERRAIHQLHHQIVRSDIVKLANVWMIQLRDCASLTLEPLRELLLRNLDGHDAIQPRVTRLIHFAHTTGANGREDLIRAEFRANT